MSFKKLLLLFVVGIAFAQHGKAQSQFDSALVNHISPGGFFDTVYDRMGNAYPLRTLAVNDTFRAGFDSLETNVVSTCTSGYFQLYMEAGSGFEDGSGTDNARLAVLCRALYDLSAFIQSPLRSSGQKINVWVRKNGTLNAPMMGYASALYTTPKGASGNITDNTLWVTIQSGTDAYKNICSPMIPGTAGGAFFHVIMSFDFSAGHNWHTDLTTAPSGAEFDLYTVALREMAHALGFASAINSDGTSLIGNNNFTRFDQFLATQGGTPLITNSGAPCTLYNYSFNSAVNTVVLSPNPSACFADSTNCDSALQYNGSLTALVYTPNCYDKGRSLSDFEDECMGQNNLYYVTSNKTIAGSMKRYLKPEEWAALTNIGYMTDTVYGDSANLNYYNYGSNISPTITVAGINDGISSNGTYAYTTHGGSTIAIGGILANDQGADAFEGLTVMSGTGSVSATDGSASDTITYTPGAGDARLQLLRYVPYNSRTGIRGNVTYIYVYGTGPGGTCTAPSACEMLPDGGFENVIDDCGAPIGYSITSMNCWEPYIGAVGLFSTTCSIPVYAPIYSIPGSAFNVGLNVHPSSASSNYHYVGIPGSSYSLFSTYGPGYYSGALQTTISTPFINGVVYNISFWGSNYTDGVGSTGNNYIQFGMSSAPLVPFGLGMTPGGALFALPPAVIPIGDPVPVTNDPALNDWDNPTITYAATTAVAGYTNFVVAAVPWYPNPAATVYDYFLLDDISVQPVTFPITGTTGCAGGSYTFSTSVTWLSSYQWQLNGVDITGATGTSYTATTAGNYTLNAVVNGCPVTSNTIVVAPACVCNTFGGSSNYTQIGQSGTLNTNLSAGNYYIGNDVTISGNLNFTDAVILMADNTTMHVAAGSWLTLAGCHLFGCDMWDGIVLDAGSGGTQSGSLYLQGDGSSSSDNTLVEDALTGVDIENPVFSSSPDYILYADGAVFNRNHTGIYIANYTPTTTPYPFYIANSVFTTRDLSIYSGGSGNYPYAWPPVGGPEGLKTYAAPTSLYTEPFNIDASAYLGSGLSVVGCKDGDHAQNGILLNDVGASVLTNPPPLHTTIFLGHYDYYGIVVGDATTTTHNTYQNLFDQLFFGINATNTNLTSFNNAFIHAQPYVPPLGGTPGGGDGIYAHTTNDITNHNQLAIYTPEGSSYKNTFDDFVKAVEVNDYYNIIGQECSMSDYTHYDRISNNNDYGFFVQTAKYDSIDISSNGIANVKYGVAVWSEEDGGGTVLTAKQIAGGININSNRMGTGNPWGEPVGTYMQMYQGISVQNILTTNINIITEGRVQTDNNKMLLVNNGIYVNNFGHQQATSSEDTVIIAAINTKTTQYGIAHVKCYESQMRHDTVCGTTATLATYDSIRAYYSGANTGITVDCNVARYAGRDYEFSLMASQSNWRGNHAAASHKGFVLNHGFIGAQGSLYLNNGACGDIWQGTAWSGSGFYETFTQGGALPTTSPLYISGTPGSSTNPEYNGSTAMPGLYVYGTSLLTTSYGMDVTHYCPSLPIVIIPKGLALHGFEAVAKDSVSYGDDSAAQGWIAQMGLWQAMVMDSAVADSSCILAKFDSMAALSRYNYLTTIEQALADANYDTVQTMIDSLPGAMCPPHERDSATCVTIMDNTANDYANTIVDNYAEFYELYLKFAQDTMTSSDSAAVTGLANLCPVQNGAVVYQARALYSLIYNDLTIFSDDSLCDTAITKGARPAGDTALRPGNSISDMAASGQQYTLHPNPSNGNIYIHQAIKDEQPVHAVVWNEAGQSMYKGDLCFASNTYNLNMKGLVPGLYLLELQDSEGRTFTFKFVVE